MHFTVASVTSYVDRVYTADRTGSFMGHIPSMSLYDLQVELVHAFHCSLCHFIRGTFMLPCLWLTAREVSWDIFHL